ncbi:MAG: class I SAM-dependent methyltransferase, partial [Planctomycetes bacterium]|nr:class I SAM-dependent methyltransferase [Planctomycetota bacterium]
GVEIINSGKIITIDSVDTWEGSPGEPVLMGDKSVVDGTLYDEFIANIEPVKHIVTPVKMPSVEAAKLYEDKSLFFVFIDGSHLYEAVKEDIFAWLPKDVGPNLRFVLDHSCFGIGAWSAQFYCAR